MINLFFIIFISSFLFSPVHAEHTLRKSFLRREIFYGHASWYGRHFNGRKTASGEKLSAHKLTCAHKTLPFQTKIKVTNLKNNESVIVKVNDRGPFRKNRIIDVSEKAAEKLGFKRDGVCEVKIQVLDN